MRKYIAVLFFILAGCIGPTVEERVEIAFSDPTMANLTYASSDRGKDKEITIYGNFVKVSDAERAIYAIDNNKYLKGDNIQIIKSVKVKVVSGGEIAAVLASWITPKLQLKIEDGQVAFTGTVPSQNDIFLLDLAIKQMCEDRNCPDITIDAKVYVPPKRYISKKFVNFYKTPNGKKMGRMIGGQLVEVAEEEDGWSKVKLQDAYKISDVWVKDSGLNSVRASFDIGYREFLSVCDFGEMEEWISNGGSGIGLMSCEAIYLHLGGRKGGSKYFDHYLALGFAGAKINVPSDPTATYVVISKKNLRDHMVGDTLNSVFSDEYIIVTKRVGRSGTSYSRREIDCNTGTQRYLGDGDSIQEMNGYYNVGSMNRPVSRSISYYVQRHVCK